MREPRPAVEERGGPGSDRDADAGDDERGADPAPVGVIFLERVAAEGDVDDERELEGDSDLRGGGGQRASRADEEAVSE